ncbi:MAG: bifunctional heptose 7-phosphate kinase/heptose 1-phosphate adenyltransferase [Nitrospinota bacterium]
MQGLLERFSQVRVVVIGDLVADEYIYGQTDRISREAPVLILKYRNRDLRLGAGANAAHNVRSLGAQVSVIGVVGDDEPGRQLREALLSKGIDADGVRAVKGLETSVKTRILAGGVNTAKQQVIRIDREFESSLSPELDGDLLQELGQRLKGAQALIVSDYGLGVVTRALAEKVNELARAGELLICVDSRHNLLAFKGVTAMTPNEEEVEEALGLRLTEANIIEAGRELIRRVDAQGVLLTRGSKGMILFERGGAVTSLGIYGSDEIADVTGAGDTVIGVFTLALAAGATMAQAAEMANRAGGLVVMKRGTAVLSSKELAATLS